MFTLSENSPLSVTSRHLRFAALRFAPCPPLGARKSVSPQSYKVPLSRKRDRGDSFKFARITFIKDISMDIYRRSGLERRRLSIETAEERRIGSDRRSIFKHKDILYNELKETLFFRKLNSDDFHNILNISTKKTFTKNDVVFYEGDKPSEMYILMDGVLRIKLRGKELNLITPIGIVGEMGLFTGEPRSATVIAKTDCELLRFNRFELFNLLKKNSSLNNHFQRSMIINLADKLISANNIIVTMKNPQQ